MYFCSVVTRRDIVVQSKKTFSILVDVILLLYSNRMSIAMTTITPTPCHEKAMDQSYYINVNDTTNYSHDNMP